MNSSATDTHDFNYDSQKDEMLWLLRTAGKMEKARARWKLVEKLWKGGKTPEEIGKFIGRSPSTAIYLLKRGFKEHMKQPDATWPTDAQGNRVCDIPHPYGWDIKRKKLPRPIGFPSEWTHVRSKECGNGMRYCPVCRSKYTRAKTLVEVFMHERL